MARIKGNQIRRRQEEARTTWTRFRLPREQTWIKWPAEYPDADLGPLVDVPGFLRLRLGRMVEVPENAALNILWESAEALEAFKASPRCAVVLRSLGCEDASPLRFFGLRWDSGFSLGEARWSDGMHGRMTVDILGVEGPHEEVRRVLHKALAFIPESCDDLLVRPYGMWQCLAWVEADSSKPQDPQVWYQFFRWNEDPSSAEREEAATRDPATRESWQAAVTKATPPVVSWEQERWDIRVAPCHVWPHAA